MVTHHPVGCEYGARMEGDITLGSTGQDGFGHFDPASRRLAIYETASKQQQLLGVTLGSSALVERIENFLQVTPTDVAEPIELACATAEQAQRWELALGAAMESAGVQQPPRSMKKAGQRADGRKRRQRQKSVIELQYEAETREAEEGQREQQEMVEVEKELEEQAQAELDEAEQELQDFEQFTAKREAEITQRAEEHAAEVYGMSELEADILANQSMLEDDQDVVQQVEEELAGKQAQYEKLVAVLDSLQLGDADDVGFTADDDEKIIEAELNAEDQSVQEVQEELARRTAEIVAESAEVAAERLSELENRIMRQIDRVEQEQESVNAQADEIELEADDAQQSVDNPRYAQELDALRVEMESATSKQIAQINEQAESPIEDYRRSDMASGSQPLVVHNPEEEELRVQIAELEGKLQVLKVEITKQDGNMSPHTRNGSNTAFQPTAETHREHGITKLVDTTSQLKSQTATDNAEMESARRRASQLVRDIERARSRLQNLRGDEGGDSTGVGNAATHSGQDDKEMLQNKVVAAKAALADQQQQISGLESAYRATQLAIRAEEEALLKARSRYTPKMGNYLAGSSSTQRVMDSRDGMSSYDEIQLQTYLTLDQVCACPACTTAVLKAVKKPQHCT